MVLYSGKTDSEWKRIIDTREEGSTREKEIFDKLYEKRQEIEQSISEELEWGRIDDKRASRISLYYPGEIRVMEEERWPEARTWLVEAMGKMRDVFDPVLKALRLT